MYTNSSRLLLKDVDRMAFWFFQRFNAANVMPAKVVRREIARTGKYS